MLPVMALALLGTPPRVQTRKVRGTPPLNLPERPLPTRVSSSEGIKHLLDLIHKIIHIHLKNNKKKLLINWYYKDDDEDILEQGTFFSSFLDVPINLIKII